MDSDAIGVVVGMRAEARIARRFWSRVATGGEAARDLLDSGATVLLSFGLAGGLDPALRPGDVVVPAAVISRGVRYATQRVTARATLPIVMAREGGPSTSSSMASSQDVDDPAKPGHDTLLLGADAPVATVEQKRRLWHETGAAAVDLESGAVARTATEHGVPFAVLRVVCDPAGRALPPAALAALDTHGAIGLMRVLASLVGDPRQFPALLRLAADAAVARRALIRHCTR